MNRRLFLKTAAAALLCTGTVPAAFAKRFPLPGQSASENDDRHIRDYLYKMRHFDENHENDICLSPGCLPIVKSLVNRLKRLQRTVGHGNFYLLSFDEALQTAKNYSRVGAFTDRELDFLEKLFYEDGAIYGFLGEKPLKNLTNRIKRPDVVKIPHTGNYLFKGEPVEIYEKIRREIGPQVILTSGIRSVIKQFMLFLDKVRRHEGNLSLASRSLAPPGYSYHGVGDFDVGQIGYGVANFTKEFTRTRVYHRLEHLGYVRLRYRQDNLLGVRYEPWHIKVAAEG